ncbi:MAG: hypothetical protein PHN39_02805 [Candidatus Pacebacteria bacterium]|nr:hypothetical protein [Candidatus Paceibacterota bacterium]
MGKREWEPVVSSSQNIYDIYVDGNNTMGRCIENGYLRQFNWADNQERLIACKITFRLILRNRGLLSRGRNILVVFDSIDGEGFEDDDRSSGVYVKMIILRKGKADGRIKQLIRKGSIVVTADDILGWIAIKKKGAAEVVAPQRLFPRRYKKGKHRKKEK